MRVPDRAEKDRRKSLLSPIVEAEKAKDRAELRERHGDDFADLAEAVDPFFAVYERQPTALTRLQQAVLDTWVLSGVVGNGGFDAWIRSNGHRAVETITGLRLLGQQAVADVVASALVIMGDLNNRTDPAEAIEALSEDDFGRLESLSEKVWAADDALEQAKVGAIRSEAWQGEAQ